MSKILSQYNHASNSIDVFDFTYSAFLCTKFTEYQVVALHQTSFVSFKQRTPFTVLCQSPENKLWHTVYS